MHEDIKYINNVNEVVQFGKEIYANQNELRDYAWSYDIYNNRITNFRRGVTDKSLSLLIYAKTEKDGISLKNKIFEVFEKDVLMNKKGKFIVGDYYYKCFIVEGKNSDFLYTKKLLRKDISIITDEPFWIKETTTSFRTNPDPTGTKNLDYNFDFPFDFTSELKNKTLINPGFVASNFKIIVYGPVINPTIHISGHTYQVNCEISDNEYLTIDSLIKTITLTKYNGEEVNCFNNRHRESYIFEKIPTGSNIVTSDGAFGFDVILIEERSEPKWI